jgi:CheY-like chemotaxis protein
MHQDMNPHGGDVLVVDDDPAILDLVVDLLTDEGYRFRRAYHGLEAWQAITSAPPRLLVTDLRMPVMDGIELVARLRASGYDFPILLMAATPALSVPLLQLDCIEFIAKPFQLEELLERIRGYVAPTVAQVVEDWMISTPTHAHSYLGAVG